MNHNYKRKYISKTDRQVLILQTHTYKRITNLLVEIYVQLKLFTPMPDTRTGKKYHELKYCLEVSMFF